MSAINNIESNSFAAACYDSNSINDLKAALAGAADKNDMAEWGLGETEWREQIELAIAALEEKAAE